MTSSAPGHAGPLGTAFVVSGPSGAGKSTVLRSVLETDPGVRFSISHTTRPPRAGEVDGRDYHFVDRARFRELAAAECFLEWAEYQDNLYGTSREAVEGPTREGLDLILEVEIEGARQLQSRLREAVFVFIMPPSMKVLEQRLRGRGSDTDAVISKRLERAGEEIKAIRMYSYVIVNDDVGQARSQLSSVIEATRVQRDRVLPRFVGHFDFG